MPARDIIESLIPDADWNEDSVIDMLCEYIDAQKTESAFEDFVKRFTAFDKEE